MKIIIAGLITLIIASLFAPHFIKFTKKLQFGQSIREDGPQWHKSKSGTPTMGGIIFLLPALLMSLIVLNFEPEVIAIVIVTYAFALIGFLDDFIKVVLKRNLGLTSKQKLAAQLLVSIGFILFLIMRDFDTALYIPGTELNFDLSYFYYILVLIILVGTSNATNLTDGLDGLLGSTGAIVVATFTAIAFALGQTDLALFGWIFAIAMVGFLFFNAFPAKVFMGDTGSLAVGGLLASMAIVLKLELLLVLVGIIFVMETLSVIIQVASYKTRKKRVFRMTPIHHHFEMGGLSEVKIVKRFSLVTFIACAISLAIILI